MWKYLASHIIKDGGVNLRVERCMRMKNVDLWRGRRHSRYEPRGIIINTNEHELLEVLSLFGNT